MIPRASVMAARSARSICSRSDESDERAGSRTQNSTGRGRLDGAEESMTLCMPGIYEHETKVSRRKIADEATEPEGRCPGSSRAEAEVASREPAAAPAPQDCDVVRKLVRAAGWLILPKGMVHLNIRQPLLAPGSPPSRTCTNLRTTLGMKLVTGPAERSDGANLGMKLVARPSGEAVARTSDGRSASTIGLSGWRDSRSEGMAATPE